ncbi:putative metal-dependent HD superfamily phosphohydrolase [Neolewinella xylanilytica]|uniref:Putative metal-dependent HD superfamily phosphohydrolase n=1 Tax=Neolewinella xylanilytica TaxID=1514080 RepID=A0A2S6I7L4_9BACT|nr:hypothetical protein [Neolewinella xylanilytica]PPK87494.1 putative metal-dependent HD superfamily phosphohydrolase [Neolewinella xylanilytica]
MVEAFFTHLCDHLDCPQESWKNVRKAYAGRAYHNLDHLDEMLAHLPDHVPPLDPSVFGIALVYHDIVYKPTRSDNERRSAHSAERLLEQGGKLTPDRIRRCTELILATKEHLPSLQDNGDESLLIDLDLAVLARPPEAYDRYTAALRQEFWMVPGFVFRSGRRKVLTTLLDRTHIYHTELGRATYEGPARENLWRELREL